MNDSLGLLKDLPQRANQLLGIWPKEKWHPRALKILDQEFPKDQPLGIACSAGADSTFCLLLIYAAFPKLRKQMMILHYNHQLRGAESDGDESFVSKISKVLRLRCIIEKPNKDHKLDENTLRTLRLEFWNKLEKEEAITKIVQGHHLDDVAETLLWRIPRGTSVNGLISPKPISQIDNITILRPFIHTTKDLIRESLLNCSIPWREDESNKENKYLRNKMRNSVLPIWKKSSDRDLLQGIASSRDLLENDSEALEFHALESLQKCRSGNRLKLATLRPLPIATQRRVVQKWIVEQHPKTEQHESLATKAAKIIKSLWDTEFSIMYLSDEYFVRKDENYLDFQISNFIEPISYSTTAQDCSLFLPNGSIVITERINLGKELMDQIFKKDINPQNEAFLSSTKLNERLYIRSRMDGDRYKPMGAPGSRKVSDWMIDRKWTETQKVQTPIFLNCANEIVWIPGFAPAEFTKVTVADKSVIRLTYRHTDT